jgi:tripartite-type tricarboxylate transporter receptor subunit TctC
MLRTIAALVAVLGCPHIVNAQDWPARPVTLIVPYAAGGPVDTIGRILAAQLSEILNQQVVVENAGGAGGMTGASPRPRPMATPSCYRAAQCSPSTRPSTRDRSTTP